MGFISLKYGGAFMIYITLEPRNLRFAKNQAIQFLRQVRNENFSKDEVFGDEKMYAYDFLLSAKNQIAFNIQQAQENGLALAGSLATYFLLNESPAKTDYLTSIKKQSSSDMRQLAAKYLSKGEYVLVSILPKKK
jgi:predicted Zn-dependent peptidase